MSDTNITSHSNEIERRIVAPIGRRLRIVETAPSLIDEAIDAQGSQDRTVVPGLFSPFVGQEITTELQTPPVNAVLHQGAIAVESGMISATPQQKMMAEAQRKANALAKPIGEPDVYLGQAAA